MIMTRMAYTIIFHGFVLRCRFHCNLCRPKSSAVHVTFDTKIESLDELSSVGVAGHNSAEGLSTLCIKQRSVQRPRQPVCGYPIGNSRPFLVWKIEEAQI